MAMSDNLLIPASDLYYQYNTGLVRGCTVDDDMHSYFERKEARRNSAEFAATMPIPNFENQSNLDSKLKGSSKGKLCTPWKYYMKIDPLKALFGAQATGDCVSWGVRTAIDITRVWEILVKGDAEEYIKRQATAMLYAARGHTSQGADPARISKAAVNDGILLEQSYLDGKYDFTEYSKYVQLGIRSGRTGLPQDLKEVTRQNRIGTAANCRNMDALADACWNGYMPHVGSGIGVSKTGDPLSRLQGGWSHDMAIVGFDDTRKYFPFRVWFWDQSWGNWNRVLNIPKEWMPWGQGMFALSEDDTWRAVKGGGCYVFSNTSGFPARASLSNSLI
jgi:hypothetical protein